MGWPSREGGKEGRRSGEVGEEIFWVEGGEGKVGGGNWRWDGNWGLIGIISGVNFKYSFIYFRHGQKSTVSNSLNYRKRQIRKKKNSHTNFSIIST